MRVSVDVTGERLAAGHVRDVGNAAGNPAPFFRAVARMLMRATRDRFTREAWVPLDADTVRHKAKAGQDPRILRATGRLEHALTFWGAPGQRLEFLPEEMVYGLSQTGVAYYGKFHQAGRGVPKREMLKMTQRLRVRIRETFRHHLAGRRV